MLAFASWLFWWFLLWRRRKKKEEEAGKVPVEVDT